VRNSKDSLDRVPLDSFPLVAPVLPAESLVVGGESVPPGKRLKLDVPVARLPTGTMLSLPVTVINGKKPGPRLWLSAAIHGDELNGVDIIQKVVKALKPHHLSGSVIAVPVVNVFGLLEQSRYLPDRRDLNRSFPGSARGSLASRLANLFMKEVVSQCTHGIDLHTAAIHRINLPQVRANLEDEATYHFAKAFGAPIMLHASHRDGSLRQAAAKRHIPTLLYEAGEALRFDAEAIQMGIDGIYRAMAHLGMYTLPDIAVPVSCEATQLAGCEPRGAASGIDLPRWVMRSKPANPWALLATPLAISPCRYAVPWQAL
jgi:predicted deacylase